MAKNYGRYVTINTTTVKENTDLIDLIKAKISGINSYKIIKMEIIVESDCTCIIDGRDIIELTADYGFIKSLEDPNISSFVIKEVGVEIHAMIGI